MYTFPCVSFKKLPLFEDARKDQSFPNLHRYEAIIDVLQLPLNLPCAPRSDDKNSTSVMADSIKPEDFFRVLEGGLAISAANVQYDEKTKMVTLSFDAASNLQGVIPYEHFYEIIKKYISENHVDLTDNKQLGLGIMTGINSCFW